jgi:hypothetical protein
MAKSESNATTQTQTTGQGPKPRDFQPVRFSREEVEGARLPGSVVRSFADDVHDVSAGAASILRLIEWDDVREDDHKTDPDAHPAPVLGAYYRNVLLRLVAINMDMLCQEADRINKWAYEQHTPEGRAEVLAEAMRREQHPARRVHT